MFRYSSLVLAALLVCGSDAFQPPKPSKSLASLDASYIERAIDWPDLLELPPPNPVENNYNEQGRMAAPSAPTYAPEQLVDLSKVSNLLTPAEAFEALVQKGEYNAAASNVKTLFSSALGGCYVGMGAMVSLAVAGNSPGLAAADPGLQKLLFGALFPVNLLLALQCGGQLFTGNTANMMAAVCEGRADFKDMGRSLGLSWVGNFIGCTTFAVACKYAGVLEGGSGHLAANMLAAKTSYELGPLFVKAMFCNWLVCLAVFLSMQAKDMGGKYLSIWLPVSTFVSIGFEHSVANMFLLPAGLMSTNDITIETALVHNLIPVTIGNAVAGSLLVGAAMSFMYGKLGEDK
jgi:formate/nitrite transporter